MTVDATVPVGSLAGCQGGFPGVFDMSGNAAEWEDSCGRAAADASTAKDPCILRGGSYQHSQSGVSCTGLFSADRSANPGSARRSDASRVKRSGR